LKKKNKTGSSGRLPLFSGRSAQPGTHVAHARLRSCPFPSACLSLPGPTRPGRPTRAHPLFHSLPALSHGTAVAVDGQLTGDKSPARRSRTNSTTRTPRTLLQCKTDTTRLEGGLTAAIADTVATRSVARRQKRASDEVATKTRRASRSGAHREHLDALNEGGDGME
jgi:hypothetical protein